MKIENFGKLVANFHNKKDHFMHTTNLKQALNHKLVLNKFRRVIKFNQES